MIGLLDKKAKMGRLAISFINEALRLQKIRLFYHRYVYFFCFCNVAYMYVCLFSCECKRVKLRIFFNQVVE